MFPVLVVFAALAFGSCGKNAEEALALLTETEAAEIVENSVSDRSAGATLPTVDVTQLIESALTNCGIPGDTTLQRSKTTGAVTYNYTFNLGWLVNCNNLNIPQSASVTVGGNGAFATARWTGADTASGSLTLTGLSPQATAYVLAGNYTLQGSATGNYRKVDPTLSCNTALTLTDLNIRKSDHKITGGTGTAVVTVSSANGQTQTVNGALLFNGDGTVTLTVNGHTHTFPIQ